MRPRALGDAAAVGLALHNLSVAHSTHRHLDAGRRLAEEALATYRDVGDTAGEANALWAIGLAATFGGDWQAGREVSRRALEPFVASESPATRSTAAATWTLPIDCCWRPSR